MQEWSYLCKGGGLLARMEAIGWAMLSAILCLVLAVLLYLKQVYSNLLMNLINIV